MNHNPNFLYTGFNWFNFYNVVVWLIFIMGGGANTKRYSYLVFIIFIWIGWNDGTSANILLLVFPFFNDVIFGAKYYNSFTLPPAFKFKHCWLVLPGVEVKCVDLQKCKNCKSWWSVFKKKKYPLFCFINLWCLRSVFPFQMYDYKEYGTQFKLQISIFLSNFIFSSSSNSALFKSYYQIQKLACTFMHIVLACMHISIQFFLGASLIIHW